MMAQCAMPAGASSLENRDLHRRVQNHFRSPDPFVRLAISCRRCPPSKDPGDMMASRMRYWEENPRHQFAQANREYLATSHLLLEQSSRAADMCHVTERRLFDGRTNKEIFEKDFGPWLTFDPPVGANYLILQEPPAAVHKPLVSPEAQQFVLSHPAMLADQAYGRAGEFFQSFNIGCHDEYPGDEPEPDYHAGAARVDLGELLTETGPIVFLRAVAHANSWDYVGRSWVCFYQDCEDVLVKAAK